VFSTCVELRPLNLQVQNNRMCCHLTSNSLLNSHQSAYCKHHSTETALLCIHDHLISTYGITESNMPLPTWPLCDFRHYWPWHLDRRSLILVWQPRLCSQLVQVISVISLLPCPMWNRPVSLTHILLTHIPPRLCLWSTTLRHVHHSSQYPHFLLFPKPSSLQTWHSTLPFLSSDSLRL